MNEDLLVIKKNEVPAIQFNKEELIERVDEILKQHKGILYTIEDIPEAKKVVADLRIKRLIHRSKNLKTSGKKKEKIISEKHMKMFSFMRYLKNILYVRSLRI